MNINKLLQYFSGYVSITVEGYYIEKFINLCNNNNILLWNLKRENSIILHTNIDVKQFKQLKAICKKTKCKVKINNKKGIPFVIKKYRKRKFFIIFLLLIIFVIFFLSNFIWNIEIKGTNSIKTEEIISLLESEGLTIGKWKRDIDVKDIINEIRLQRDDVAWVGINIKGTNAIVEIVEADAKPEIIDENEYCNIIADKEGIISKITSQNGTSLVKEGDVVTKGDILIAGWMEGKYTGKQYVHARGEIEAKVWYTNTQKIYLREKQKRNTGKEETTYSVKLNNFQINFNKSIPNFQKYDTIETCKKLRLFSDFYLPIELIEYTHQEYEEIVVIHSIEEAKQIGIEKATEALKENIENKEITDRQINVKTEYDYIEVEVIYEIKEKIGLEEKLIF